MNKNSIGIILGIMCFLLTVGIFIQVKTINGTNQTSVTKTIIENELRNNILKEKEKYDNTYSKVEKLEKELEGLRDSAASKTNQSQELQDKLDKYDRLLGYTELTGKGVIVTLDDGDLPALNQKIATDYIVHDGDLVQVINDLRNAGAEAISVNDQRIVNTSAVSCIGNVVKINGEKVGAPYKISAIGAPDVLYSAMKIPGGYLDLLTKYGVKVSYEKSYEITVPKFEGVYNFTYMKTVE